MSELNMTPNKNTESAEIQKDRFSFVDAIEYMELFAIAICCVVLVFSFLFRLCTVNGESMKGTLTHGDSLLVSDFFYQPERGDIIVFHQTGSLNEPVVKRVIATEGETVHIRHFTNYMTVTVTDVDGNTTQLEEDYIIYEGFPYYPNNYDVTVPEGKLFVMGDNRNNSKDSRHSDIGLVDQRRVLGKVIFRITPISKFGSVY